MDYEERLQFFETLKFILVSILIICFGCILYLLDCEFTEATKKVISMEIVDKYIVEGHMDCSNNQSRICSYVDEAYTLKVKSTYEDNSVKEVIKEVNSEYYDKVSVGDILDSGIIK